MARVVCLPFKRENDEVRLQVIESSNATGIIDPITGLLVEGYAVLARDDYGQPILEAYFEPNATHFIPKDQEPYSVTNTANIPLLVPVIHRPDAVRPFGRSRITRAGMYYQKYAKRTLERADITAEFYSWPQKYIIGLDPDAEPLEKWKATVSSLLTISASDTGEKAKYRTVHDCQHDTIHRAIENSSSWICWRDGPDFG